MVLGLGGVWGPWTIIAASGVICFVGAMTLRPILEHPSLASLAPYVFYIWAWISSLILAGAFNGGEAFNVYVGLGMILNIVISYLVYTLLERRGVLDRLDDPDRREIWTLYWFTYVLSASVPTSLGLARLNNAISLFPIVVYGMVFGWFGPEVIPRVIPRDIRPFLLLGAYFFFILLLYGLLETVNPALKYLTPDWVVVVLLSYVSCHAMLVSRCSLEALKPPKTDKE